MASRASFDWMGFCVSRGIDFIRSGKNVSGNHIAIKCPFCGAADPSEHMVLSLDESKPYWYCWRDQDHRGRNPSFLIARLGGMSLAAARSLVDEGIGVLDSEWNEVVNRLVNGAPEVKEHKIRAITLPKGVNRLTDKKTNFPFLDYLEGRGFSAPEKMIRDVELYASFFGWFAYRIVFPIYHDGKLVNLMGRDITGKHRLRYRALPADKAGLDLDHTVYNHDDAMLGGQILWMVEGPMDALKLNWYGDKEDSAVALFGMPKGAQIAVLNRLAKWFDVAKVVLDSDSIGKSLRLQQQLAGPIATGFLPGGAKDVGAMSARMVKKFSAAQKRTLTPWSTYPTCGPAATH